MTKPLCLSLPLWLALTACSAQPQHLLQLAPGAKGTFMAVGTETELSVKPPDSSWTFKVKNAQTKDISIGAAVGGDQTADPDGSYDETQQFIPASITKVLTSAIALKNLGADYRFNTDINWTNDTEEEGTITDVIVYSDGDPQVSKTDTPDGLVRSRIKEIVQKLKAAQIKRVKGEMRLVSSDPRKDFPTIIPGTETSDNLACFGALAQGFNYRRNCADVQVLSPLKTNWADSDLDFPTVEQIETGSKTALDVEGVKDATGVVSSYMFTGAWNDANHSSNATWFALPVSNAKAWFGRALLTEMKAEGIDASGAQLIFPAPAEGEALLAQRNAAGRGAARVSSDALADLLRFMNKPSDDFLGDALFKAIAEHAPSMSNDGRQQGVETYKAEFANWLSKAGSPAFASDMKINDGAGLSRANLVSARAYLALMREFAKEPTFPALWNSLPIAGRDGTLKGRMGGTVAENFVHAKTGTVRGAYQLAGWIPRMSGGKVVEYVPFVILSAATPATRFTVHAFQDSLVVELVKAINPGM